MESELTVRQRRIFEFIRRHITEWGYGPTVREIAEAFDIASPNGVVCHLNALVNKGFIVRTARKSRSIELSPEYQEETRGLPLAGEVAAGAMHEAIEQQERIDFGRLLEKRGAFALKVRGDSMIEAQICDGDYVIVHPRRTANSGDIVVVRTDDGEATLKYWYPEKNRVRLQPANRSMKPIYRRDVRVLGVVKGVVRTMV
jgi:repressor LexA